MEGGHKYASFSRRFVALFIDAIILSIIGISISFLLNRNPFDPYSQANSVAALDYILTYLLSFLFTTIFWVNYNGQTPGKRAMHIKIIKDNGQPLDWGTAIIRYVSYLVSTLFLYIGYIWALFDRKKQTWHDKIARTYVIESDRDKPSKLFYLLPIVTIFLLGILATLGVIAAVTWRFQKYNSPTNVALRKQTNAIEMMSPQTRQHWDKSQELFAKMKAEKDPVVIKKLNDENIAELKKAIETDPTNARIWVELGAAYTWVSTKGTLQDSYLAYKKASEIEPDNLTYNNYVGDALIALGEYEDAIAVLNQTIRKTDKSSFAYQSLGKAYESLKVYDQARENYQKSLSGFQEQNDNGQYDSAILELHKALARLPKT